MMTRKIVDFRVRGSYPLWPGFPAGSASQQFCNFPIFIRHHLTTPAGLATCRFGLLPFRSPLLGECFRLTAVCFLFLQVLRCFTSLGALLASSARLLAHR